jgi:hypothetical protein
MIESIQYQDGQTVEVWCNASGWQRAVIVGHRLWSHFSGNTHVAYRLDLGPLTDGTPETLECSANSLRPCRARRGQS